MGRAWPKGLATLSRQKTIPAKLSRLSPLSPQGSTASSRTRKSSTRPRASGQSRKSRPDNRQRVSVEEQDAMIDAKIAIIASHIALAGHRAPTDHGGEKSRARSVSDVAAREGDPLSLRSGLHSVSRQIPRARQAHPGGDAMSQPFKLALLIMGMMALGSLLFHVMFP